MFMVKVDRKGQPTKVHETVELARAEARRLSDAENRTAYVLGVLETITPQPEYRAVMQWGGLTFRSDPGDRETVMLVARESVGGRVETRLPGGAWEKPAWVTVPEGAHVIPVAEFLFHAETNPDARRDRTARVIKDGLMHRTLDAFQVIPDGVTHVAVFLEAARDT